MKVAFFLQRNFALVGDALAGAIKELQPDAEFCGYVQSRSSLHELTKTPSVPYSKLILDEDLLKGYKDEKLDFEYLKSLEKKYGIPNMWPYLTVDRVLMHGQLIREYPYDELQYTHEELLKMMQTMAKRIEKFLDEEKPDHLVSIIIGSLGASLLYHIGVAKGVRTHIICPTLFENRFLFSSEHNNLSIRKELGNNFDVQPAVAAKEAAQEFLKAFRNKPTPPVPWLSPDHQPVNRRKQFNFLSPGRIINSLRATVREFRIYRDNPHRDDYTTVNPAHFLIDRLQRKLRNLRGVADLYDKPSEGEDYAFFPLHYEPEIALSVWAPKVGTQLDAVRRTAEALPVGWKLYVKEHPQMVEYRPRAFYEALKKIPNVKLINPSKQSFSLIRGSKLCVIITSSVGFEATLLGKPVVTLANHFINDLSFVKHCKHLDELDLCVKSQIENYEYNEAELIHLLAKIIENSAQVDLMSLWLHDKTPTERLLGIRPLAELFLSRTNLA